MERTLVGFGMAALAAALLVGCGAGTDGVDGQSPPPTVITVSTPGTSTESLTSEEWAQLSLKGQVTKVTVNSPPEVTFVLTDDNGNAITGLEKNTTTSNGVTSYANVALSIAKLVPGSNGSPSKWVSYIVTSNTGAPSRPGTDNAGTLTYNGNGTYTYKFLRDITTIKAQVDASTDTSTNKKADLGDLTYQPNLTHRVVVQISGAARGTGSNTANGVTVAPQVLLKNPINIVYDFVPATGQPVTASNTQRDIANTKKCFECHTKFVGFHGSTPELGLSGVGSSRQDTRMCVVCHTDQRKFGRTNATPDGAGNFAGTETNKCSQTNPTACSYRFEDRSLLDFPVMVHKIHMGEELGRTGYDIAGLQPNHVRYPQLITNCVKCHDGTSGAQNATAQGDNWKTVPNRAACGACHDKVDFATASGTKVDGSPFTHSDGGISAGNQLDDSQCASCHTASAIAGKHVAVSPPDTNSSMFSGGTNNNTNSAWIASNWDNLPAGAIKVSYDIKSVSRNGSKQPVMVFRMLQDGNRVDFNNPASASEIWNNFVGAPSVYFVFAVPQDGMTTAPSDFNVSASSYVRNLWNGVANTNTSTTDNGTLAGPDSEGFYTATLTGVTIPDNAVMLTGGLGYSYAPKTTMPLTQTNLADYPVTAATGSGLTSGMPNVTGGLIVVSPDASKVASAGCTSGVPNCTSSGGYVGRRVIVDDTRCNNCHKELGVFNKSNFHAGQRNDAPTCSWCHTPNRASQGWSADSTAFVHAIHGGLKRGDAKFTWRATSDDGVTATDGFFKIGYPGVLSNCEACHVPGSYDFSNSTNRTAADRRLFRTVAAGDLSAVPAYQRAPDAGASNYGAGFSFNVGTGTTTAEAAATTLVTSPTTVVCSACHATTLARSHMEAFGASIYKPRSSVNLSASTEQCFICHDSGRIADIKAVHSK